MSPAAPQVSFSPMQHQTPVPWVQHTGFSQRGADEHHTMMGTNLSPASRASSPAKGSPCIKHG